MNSIANDDTVDHRQIIASLTNEERGRLTGKSDGPGLVQFALHLGAIVLLGALIAARVPWVASLRTVTIAATPSARSGASAASKASWAACRRSAGLKILPTPVSGMIGI